METCELGTIKQATIEDLSLRTHTVQVQIMFEGFEQGFGGCCFCSTDSTDLAARDDFTNQLCRMFNVEFFYQLAGKQCFALRCFKENNTPIEGLRTLDGKSFTLTNWRKKFWPMTLTPLQREMARRRDEVERLKKQLAEHTDQLLTAAVRYTSWE